MSDLVEGFLLKQVSAVPATEGAVLTVAETWVSAAVATLKQSCCCGSIITGDQGGYEVPRHIGQGKAWYRQHIWNSKVGL